MNKLLFTLISSLLVSATFSQKTELIDAIDKLDFYSKRKFQDITDKKLSTDSTKYDVKTTYSSKLTITGAKDCKIVNSKLKKTNNINQPDFIAWYGDFKTLAEANKKADEIVSQIKQANKGFYFDTCKQFISGYKIRVLARDMKEKIKIYNAIVDIQENKTNNTFSTLLTFRSNNESKEYTIINIDENQEAICKQIRYVLACGDESFDELKGKKISSGTDTFSKLSDGLSPKYTSTLQLPGTRNCYVESELVKTKFVAETANQLTADNANKMLQQLFQTVAYSLGKGYAYWIAPDNSNVKFVKLNQYNYSYNLITLAEIVMKLENNLFDSYIYFYPPDKMFSE